MWRRLLLHIMLSSSTQHASGWMWSAVKCDKAPRVSGQSTAGSENGVLLFGGLTGAAGSPTVNDLWHFANDKWTQLLPDDEDSDLPRPRVRMYAASAMIGSKFYIFGGWDPGEKGSGGEFLDDIWSFDWTDKMWREEGAKLPYPVSRHAAVSVGGNNMAVIHTYKGILTYKDGVIAEQDTKGCAPDALSMCAMAAIENKVFVFGGADKTQNMSSDLYALDIMNWTWTKLECKGDGPTALASASMAPLSGDQCILFGGAGLSSKGYEGGYGLQPKNDTWICTITEKQVEWERIECNTRPEGRLAASLNRLGEDRFLLQGGYDSVSKETFEEAWILSNK